MKKIDIIDANGKINFNFNGRIISPPFSEPLKKVLGVSGSRFPQIVQKRESLSIPIPAISVSEKNIKEIEHILKIYVTPSSYFEAKFRNIFKETTITFKSASECRTWLNHPQFKYWPQQLNFVVWCATSGCGIPSGLESLPLMIQSLLRFHVYFTIRRILYELGCPLPGDSMFKQKNNNYKKIVLEKLVNEFNIGRS